MKSPPENWRLHIKNPFMKSNEFCACYGLKSETNIAVLNTEYNYMSVCVNFKLTLLSRG